jgi:hypothetical protein
MTVKTRNGSAAALGRLGGRGLARRAAAAEVSATPEKNPAAVALGRLGGLKKKGKTSAAIVAAAKENGRKGGRPRMTLEQRVEQLRAYQSIRCSKCSAKAGEQCRDMREADMRLDVPHPERVADYKAKTKA